jgi:hypothetical protein
MTCFCKNFSAALRAAQSLIFVRVPPVKFFLVFQFQKFIFDMVPPVGFLPFLKFYSLYLTFSLFYVCVFICNFLELFFKYIFFYSFEGEDVNFFKQLAVLGFLIIAYNIMHIFFFSLILEHFILVNILHKQFNSQSHNDLISYLKEQRLTMALIWDTSTDSNG